jgi:hypothetical protein
VAEYHFTGVVLSTGEFGFGDQLSVLELYANDEPAGAFTNLNPSKGEVITGLWGVLSESHEGGYLYSKPYWLLL